MKRQPRAFKILYSHRFVDGKRVSKTDYMQTDNPSLIEHLIKSQGAVEVEAGKAPAEAAKVLAVQPTTDRAAEVDGDTAGDDEPDWDYRTISDMRTFLDACGVELPSVSARKPVHVQVCRAAWVDDKRPHPFYGLPGGPSVGAGLPGPNGDDPDVLADAIATAIASGFPVPDETRQALEAILGADEDDEDTKPFEDLTDEDDEA